MNTAKNLAVNGKNAYFFYIPFRQKMKNQIKISHIFFDTKMIVPATPHGTGTA